MRTAPAGKALWKSRIEQTDLLHTGTFHCVSRWEQSPQNCMQVRCSASNSEPVSGFVAAGLFFVSSRMESQIRSKMAVIVWKLE